MVFNVTPNVHVRRDANGTVRQLSHPNQPYRQDNMSMAMVPTTGSPSIVTPRGLADEYLRDVAPIYNFANESLGNLAAAPAAVASPAVSTELRFREEKNVANSVTVSYDQTHFGLPIWNAGVAVRINTQPMQVTGSHNATEQVVQVDPPDASAPYMPHRLGTPILRELLRLGADDNPEIHATRLLIYLYQPEDRFDSQVEAHNAPAPGIGLGGAEVPPFPTLQVPPVPDSIRPGHHYVVSEVLFALPRTGWGMLNWRVFIEPKSGAVLYVRALVSCAHGAVFATDPVSASGKLHTAATAAATLDALRTVVPLLGLAAGPAGGSQRLEGQYVRLLNVDPPPRSMPSAPPPFDFVYSSPTDNFASCNAYHHCDGVFRMIQGMGIDVGTYFNNTNFPISVDPHALGGQVNAQARGNATGNGLGALVFGSVQSGQSMGIAADVRVVLHEFGHALLWDHVSSPNFGFAHSAGDSLAAILHDPESHAPDRFDTFPFMNASSGLLRRHDRAIANGWAWFGPQYDRQYQGEQILSTTLFRVYRSAGGDDFANPANRAAIARYMAYLIIKSCGMLSFMTPDPDVYVQALIDADVGTVDFNGLPGGTLAKVIRWSFEKQGLYQPPGAPHPVMTEGAPPEVDVYIDDGRHGAYMPYLADFRGQPELWNRHAPDGANGNQPANVGAVNHAYVIVRNRGTIEARDVTVRAFQSRLAGADTWPRDWTPARTPVLAVPGPIAPGGHVTVGPFEWLPQAAGDSLLMAVSAPGDLNHLETIAATPIHNARLVPLDNNIAQRTF